VTPQSSLLLIAPLAAGREAALRQLLESMTSAPGVANPNNGVLPFAAFDQLHFARLVLLEDPNVADIAAYGLPLPTFPVYLAFLADCDGTVPALLTDLVQRAGSGLRLIFAHCEGFDAQAALLPWMRAHCRCAAASFVNRRGRTVMQIRQESALQRFLAAHVARTALASASEAQTRRRELLAQVAAESRAGRLALTPPDATPPGWCVANLVHAIALPLLGLLALPFLILLLPVLILQLRKREQTDPEICPRPQAAALLELERLEDRDVSNQYTAIGSVKPGSFRRWLLSVLLLLVDYACRHVFHRGFLARVQTIHFAHWAFLDSRRRVVFVSNYDGSHQSYMDDFINKVGWGLNLLFSNGVGWPRTDWLVMRGARREHLFKYYQRRHQIPTQVWYKAYPGLALTDLERNQRIRAGLECAQLSDDQALEWLQLL
jgi:hypothetical protein